jgi:hypothetical protein
MPSSVIAEIAYDAATSTLFIRFQSGVEYAYFAVPARLYDDFRAAFSKGRFFAQRVRGRFPFRKSGPPPDGFQPAVPQRPLPGMGPASGGLRRVELEPPAD